MQRSESRSRSYRGWRSRRAELKSLRREIENAETELARLKSERTALKERRQALKDEKSRLLAQRKELLTKFGERHGRKYRKLANFERHQDVPSFVVGQRMMQRIHRHAADPAAGIDGAGALFADRGATRDFLDSHGLTYAPDAAGDLSIVVHAFHGEVGLVEVRNGEFVRHVQADGSDPGDIRSAFGYDRSLPVPERLEAIVASAVTLSAHVSRPYAQIQFTVDAEIVAVDVDPDRVPVLTDEWDERLGLMFDRSYARTMLQPLRAGALSNRVPGGVFEPEDIE